MIYERIVKHLAFEVWIRDHVPATTRHLLERVSRLAGLCAEAFTRNFDVDPRARSLLPFGRSQNTHDDEDLGRHDRLGKERKRRILVNGLVLAGAANCRHVIKPKNRRRLVPSGSACRAAGAELNLER